MCSRRLSALIIASGFGVLSLSASGQTVVYVDDSATGANDGSSWCNAYRYLQDALNGIAAAGSVGEVRVAQGVYKPDRTTANPGGNGDRDATFNIPSGTTLRGGYAGCGAGDPDARDVAFYETVLDGDLAGNDAEDPVPYFSCCFNNAFADTCTDAACTAAVCAADDTCCTTGWDQGCADLARASCPDVCGTPTRSDNSYHVMTTISVSTSTTIEGVTITGGHANGANVGPDPASRDQGSGLNNYHGRPQVRECTFVDNWADNHGALNDHGGATVDACIFRDNHTGNIGGGLYVHHTDMGPTVVTDCLFEENTALVKGAGMYNRGNVWTTLTRCRFINNRSERYGGGLYHQTNNVSVTECIFDGNHARSYGGGLNLAAGNALVRDSSFHGNTAFNGGAMYVPFGSHQTIERCTFEGNQVAGMTATPSGGAVYGYLESTVILRDCTFRENAAVEGSGGGVFGFWGEDWRVERCTFVDNFAKLGAGLFFSNVLDGVVTDSVFIGNESTHSGGGAYLYRENYTIRNSLFSGNTASNSGGGMVDAYDFTDVINCTFRGNSATKGGGIYAQSIGDASSAGQITLYNSILWENSDASGSGQSAQVFPGFDAQPIAHHSCVMGWDGSLAGTGNLSVDPMFVDPDGADNVSGTEDDDLRIAAGSPAVNAGMNAAVPADMLTDLDGKPRIVGTTVDMGAYEFAGTCGNTTCEPDENSCTCPDDCGSLPSTEAVCDDSEDNDCDLAVDCADADCNADPACAPESIPTMSEWGLIVMTLALTAAGTLVLRRRVGCWV